MDFTTRVFTALSLALFSAQAWALDKNPGGTTAGPPGYAGESPFTDYTAGVAAYVLAVGVLVAILLIGGFLVVNLGLMSKRPEDHIGKRTPSDVGILKQSTWPAEYEQRSFPAEEDDAYRPPATYSREQEDDQPKPPEPPYGLDEAA